MYSTSTASIAEVEAKQQAEKEVEIKAAVKQVGIKWNQRVSRLTEEQENMTRTHQLALEQARGECKVSQQALAEVRAEELFHGTTTIITADSLIGGRSCEEASTDKFSSSFLPEAAGFAATIVTGLSILTIFIYIVVRRRR